jgi:hypothetical protein
LISDTVNILKQKPEKPGRIKGRVSGYHPAGKGCCSKKLYSRWNMPYCHSPYHLRDNR